MEGEHQFDYEHLVDELACRPTRWLHARRAELVREQRRLRVEELAVTAVLDDRGALDDSVTASDGISTRAVRDTLETARALEHLPRIAAAAYDGRLSSEQLTPLVQLADPGSDAEWARRAPHTAPADLAQMARTQAKPSAEDARKRREARDLQMWWRPHTGMLAIRGELPDLDGALAQRVFNHMIQQMRPAKGEPWDTRGHRSADAFVELLRNYADVHALTAPSPHFVVQVPQRGPATIAGIPLPDSMVESLRAGATIEPVLVDDDGAIVATGRVRPALSVKIIRAVLLRDGHCRWPGCTRRHGLQVHHLWPSTWGGSDDISNLAAVCTGGGTDHHPQLVPHGPYLLLGNPNQPDGLQLVHRESLAELGAPIRAGPPAA